MGYGLNSAKSKKENKWQGTKKGRTHMKTIRLLYPDHVSGGLETYYFGAHLLAHILPVNDKQPLIKVDVTPPDGREKPIEDGIYGKSEVISGIKDAKAKLNAANPDKVITIGGNCLVSLASFDYLHGKYENTGIIWIDAHPDVSAVKDGYPNAHAMVLGSLLGGGDKNLTELMENRKFESDEILYIGLQELHYYQKEFLDEKGVFYKVQTDSFVSSEEITEFVKCFDHILVHFDIDVLDETFFHSTYFANPELSGDGSGGGKMKMDTLADILGQITSQADVVGFTIAEYLPFDEHRLHKMLSGIKLFTE